MGRILFKEEIKSLSQIFSVSYMKPSSDSNTQFFHQVLVSVYTTICICVQVTSLKTKDYLIN